MAKQNVELKFSIKDGVSSGLAKIGKGIDSVNLSLGKTAVAAGAATAALAAVGAGAGIVSGISAASEFEQAIARAGQAAGATGEQLAAMGEAARAASSATGATATEAAQALEALGRAGLNSKDAIAALEPVLAVARVNAIAVGDAAGRTADVLDQFGLAASQTASVADTLSAAAKASGTSFVQITDALAQAGPSARTAGVDFRTTAAALGLLAQNGIEGGKAGGALRGIFDALRDPTSKFSQALSDAGIKSRDFATVIAELGTKGAGAETAIQSLGAKGTLALQALLRDGAGALQGLRTELATSEGAAKSAADQINNTLGGAFNDLKNEITNAGIGFFEPILGPLKGGLQDVADAIKDFAESDDFASLRESFRVAFEEGLQFVRNFIAEFDFQAAITSVRQFVDDAGGKLSGFAQTADEVASAIRVATNAIGAVFNALQTVIAAAVGAIAQSQASLLTPLAAVNDTAAEMKRVLQDVADNAFEQVKVQAAQTGANVQALAESFSEATNATNTASEAAADAASNIKQLSADEERLANNAAKLAEAERQHAAAMEEAAAKAASSIDTVATAQAKLAEIERQIGDAIAGGQSQAQVQALITQANTLRASIEPVGQAAADAGAKIQKAGNDGAAAFSGAASSASRAASEIQATGEAAQQSATMAAEGTASLSGITAALFSKYSALSEAAGRFFAETQKAANVGSLSLQDYGEAIQAADRATQQAFDGQTASANALISKLQEYAQTGRVAADSTSAAFFASEGALDGMQSALDQGIAGFDLLDRQTLSGLQAALDAARQKTKQLSADARQAVADLQAIGDQLEDQALRDAGNEEEIARRDYERRIANIEEIAKRAGAAGAEGEERAKRLAREEFERKMADIQRTKAAQAEADRASADNRIAENQRVWEADPYNNQAAAATGNTQASRTTAGRGSTGSVTRGTGVSAESIAVNLNFDKGTDIFQSRAVKEEVARIVAKELERLTRRKQ